MKHSENKDRKRIGFFVDKNYFSALHQVVGEAINPKRLGEHLEDALEEDLGLEANIIIDKHLISCREAVSTENGKATETQKHLEEQHIEDLFIARAYELTTKLIQADRKELKQVYLQNSLSIKVLSEVISKGLTSVCLFVHSQEYKELLYSLKSLGIKTLVYQVSTPLAELKEEESLAELADAVLTLTLEEQKSTSTAQTTAATIFHHSEEESSSKLGELMGKIKDAPKVPIKERNLESVHTTATKETEAAPQAQEQAEDDFIEGEEYIGEIANIVKAKGFAFIKRTPANIFLYYGNMLDVDQFYELEVGTKVIYKIEKTTGGRIQAVNVFPVEE